MVNKMNARRRSLQRLFLSLLALVALNIAAQYFFYRFDLTAEKRYTLTSATIEDLKKLDDNVYIKCYLKGEFPGGFRQLQRSTKEMLDAFVGVAGKKIKYDFINPSEGNATQKEELRKQLEKKGINPINLNLQGEDKYKEQIIYPWCVISYKDMEYPVFLLNQQLGKSSSEQLNNSEALLEFNLIQGIHRLTNNKNRKKIAISEGNGELADPQLYDFIQTLALDYDVARANINQLLFIPDKVDALIIPKPSKPFSEQTKFKIDQYIMHGGKVLWLIDQLDGDVDSLRTRNEYIAPDYALNLDDQLFSYGVRVNRALLQDKLCAPIPMVTGYDQASNPRTSFFPWMYFPVIMPDGAHPIVKNMDAILTLFPNSIDTVGGKGITKTVLLHSSPATRAVFSPAFVSLRTLKMQPQPSYFTNPNRAVAVLLEGSFTSLYESRLAPETMGLLDSMNIKFVPKSMPNKMIVVADGDIVKNPLGKKGVNYPCGYYPFTKTTFANKTFLLNCVQYLTEGDGVIAARSKEIKLRILNREKVREEKSFWIWLNLSVPIALLLIAGFIITLWRERRYK